MTEPPERPQPAGEPSRTRAEKPHYAGHRDRLRARFRDAGPEALADYEILELVLFRVLPRRDTKPIAKALLARFGSLSAVFGAPVERLTEIDGIGRSAAGELKLFQALAARLGKHELQQKPLLSSWNSVLDYCRTAMAYEEREQFRVLFLDRKNRLIADEMQQQGTVDHTPVYPREVVKRALELSATALILVHNHPSGDPAPSQADIDMTGRIAEVLTPLNILLHDHIIIGRHGHASFRAMNLL